MAEERINIQDSAPINVSIQQAGAQGPAAQPVAVSATVTGGNVPSFGTLNTWTFNSPQTLILPTMPAGFQTTVHIIGFPNVTWPSGTVVYGGNAANEAWVTIIRETNRWVVLIPSDDPISFNVDAVRDSGWVNLVSGSVMSGSTTYFSGSAASFIPPAEAGIGNLPFFGPATMAKGSFAIMYRRVGSQGYLYVSGVQRTTNNVGSGARPFLCSIPSLASLAYMDLSGASVSKFTSPGAGSTNAGEYTGTAHLTIEGTNTEPLTSNVYIQGSGTNEVIGFSNGIGPPGPSIVSWFIDRPWPA